MIFEFKLVKNHYIDQSLVKLSPKSTETANFSLKTVFF